MEGLPTLPSLPELELKLKNFHCCDVPHGFFEYRLKILTAEQQTNLNQLKVDTVRENQKYLAAHPELKAIITLLLRYIFNKKPHFRVHEAIAKFFTQPRTELEDAINAYLKETEDIKPTVCPEKEVQPEESVSEKLEEELVKEDSMVSIVSVVVEKTMEGLKVKPKIYAIVKEILSEILLRVIEYKQCLKCKV